MGKLWWKLEQNRDGEQQRWYESWRRPISVDELKLAETCNPIIDFSKYHRITPLIVFIPHFCKSRIAKLKVIEVKY